MSALGHKQTLAVARVTSALPLKADICEHDLPVAFVQNLAQQIVIQIELRSLCRVVSALLQTFAHEIDMISQLV
jgi:hypothetical protein